ncbi:cell division protein ZapE [Saccharopolyspora sp. NPDC002686]|uniref:cell division protein ZapE n=1 Tax=Saccharopolyspora sp. NPDC002686 TaxID=3154541 RepID=UPI003331626D
MSGRPNSPADLRERFDAAAARRGFELDDAQRTVADKLAELGVALCKRFRRPRGLYLHGPVGRGKSFLVDTFFAEAPVPGKLRVHFHDFFDQLHRAIVRQRSTALAELLDGRQLLHFDEFHVHDPGDAALLTKLLHAVHARRITLVTTSNYRPEDLLPNPLHHHLFLPAIELVEKHQEVVALSGPTDYRTAHRSGRFAEGTWQWPMTTFQQQAPSEQTTLDINGRSIRAMKARDRLVCFDFRDLCDAATSTRDYLAIAAQYDTWCITGVPKLAECGAETRQRFANVVDVLCDQDITLQVAADHSIAETLWNGRDSERTASRLALIRPIPPD